MIRLMRSLVVLLLTAMPAVAAAVPQAPIERWDALPALDVVHLRGALAGTTVCPMCRHGYDAGLLVHLPVSTSPAEARAIATRLSAVARAIDDGRFRSFIVIDGMPSADLLDALASDAPAWHIARLTDGDKREISRIAEANSAVGYVFAQRRALFAFDAGIDDARIAAHAHYAMAFLRDTYADAVASTDPDTPKGRLWLAPNRLSESAPTAPTGDVLRACVVDATGSPLPSTLVAVRVTPTSGKGNAWLRTDDSGCLRVAPIVDGSMLDAEIFSVLQPPVHARLDGDPRDADGRPRLRSAPSPTSAGRNERIVGLPCEGCEGVFAGRPYSLSSSALLASAEEPGEKLRLSGTVRDGSGAARAGIVLLAYQTDGSGHYARGGDAARPESAHARLRAFARTDAAGRYAFDTIRPAPYPDRSTPAHIHLHVVEPGRCAYHLGDVMFDDDPLLSNALRSREQSAHGGNGIVAPVRDEDGHWQATRDIELGRHVADYADCAEPTFRDDVD